MKKVGFIFDMDGTMVDNMMVHHRAWQTKLKEVGLDLSLEEVIARCHGRNDEILERLFGERMTPAERLRISQEKEAGYRLTFREQLRLVNGLPEFLEQAHAAGIPLAIGTAAIIENVDYVLDELQIRHYFTAIVTEGDVTKGKPDPEVFHKAADLLGVPYSDCLVFEDSPTGVRAASNAGMYAVAITTTHQRPDFDGFTNILTFSPDYTRLTLADLMAQLAAKEMV